MPYARVRNDARSNKVADAASQYLNAMERHGRGEGVNAEKRRRPRLRKLPTRLATCLL